MEHRVPVLLGIRDPGHGVDSWQHGLDSLAVCCLHGVHVRQVQDRDGREITGGVRADRIDAEPGKDRRQRIGLLRRDPRDGIAASSAGGQRPR